MSLNLSLRTAALLALLLLVASPGQAASTLPAGLKTSRPAAASHRRAVGRPTFHPTPQPEALQPEAALLAVAPKMVLLAGIVRTPDGQPCPGVSVFPTTNARQLVVTDADGIFYLPVPANTPLHIQANYFGVGSGLVAISGLAPQPVSIVLEH